MKVGESSATTNTLKPYDDKKWEKVWWFGGKMLHLQTKDKSKHIYGGNDV